MSRFIEYLNEAKRKQDETAWADIPGKDMVTKYEKDFIKGIQRKSTTFYYGKWEEIRNYSPNTYRFYTNDGEGNQYNLVIEREKNQHISSRGTRDPEKTKTSLIVGLGIERGGSIPIVKKTTRGEDFEKEKKFDNQVKKVQEMLERTFGVDVKL